jgi:hypothetical protein
MVNLLAASGLVAALLAAPVTAPESAPAPDGVALEVVTVNGSGCPAGTASLTQNRNGFRLNFSGYTALTGPSAAPTDFRKNCQFNIAVTKPDGWQFAVQRAEYGGFAWLAEGGTATQRASYYFQGMSATVTTSHQLNGPLLDHWETTDVPGGENLAFSPCGEDRNLNINTEVRASAGNSDEESYNLIHLDSASFRLTWRRC